MFIPILKLAAESDTTSISYQINITVDDVQPTHIDRLVEAIERYLKGAAQRIIIATNQTFPAKFDLACAIRYPIPFSKKALKNYLRSVAIPSCFGEGKLEGRAVRVDVKPLENLDDSVFDRYKALWSGPPWKLEFEGYGSSAVRASVPGLQPSLFIRVRVSARLH